MPCGKFTYPTGKKDSTIKMTPEFKKKFLFKGVRLLQQGKSEEYVLSLFDGEDMEDEEYSPERIQGMSNQLSQEVSALSYSEGSQDVPNAPLHEFNMSPLFSPDAQRSGQQEPESLVEYLEELNISSELTVNAEGSGQHVPEFPNDTFDFDFMNQDLTFSTFPHIPEWDDHMTHSSSFDYDASMTVSAPYSFSFLCFFLFLI